MQQQRPTGTAERERIQKQRSFSTAVKELAHLFFKVYSVNQEADMPDYLSTHIMIMQKELQVVKNLLSWVT